MSEGKRYVMLTCYSAYVPNDSFYVYFFGLRFFYISEWRTRVGEGECCRNSR